MTEAQGMRNGGDRRVRMTERERQADAVLAHEVATKMAMPSRDRAAGNATRGPQVATPDAGAAPSGNGRRPNRGRGPCSASASAWFAA